MNTLAPGDLLFNFEIPTIGEIVASFRAQINSRYPMGASEKPRWIKVLLARYDNEFLTRADYRLWRFLFQKDPNATEDEETEQVMLAEALLQVARDMRPEILWPVTFMLSSILTGERRHGVPEATKDQIILYCANALNEQWLRGAETQCAFIELLARDVLQTSQEDKDAATVKQHCSNLERCIRAIDSQWVPGQSISLQSLKRAERRSKGGRGRLLLPFGDIFFEVPRRLSHVLLHARWAIREAVTEIDASADKVLLQAANYAYSAWRLMRSARLARARSSGTARLRMLGAELNVLHSAQQAAYDAGAYALSAGLAHLLLRLIPEELHDDIRFDHIEDRLGHLVHQFGLEVHGRQARTQDSQLKRPSGHYDRIFELRLVRDKLQDPRWAAINASKIGFSEMRKLLALDYIRGHSDEFSLLVLRSAFELYLHYGKMERAVKFVHNSWIDPLPAHLLKLAENVQLPLEIVPLGVDLEEVQIWQSDLRQSWCGLEQRSESLSLDEKIAIHETLLGLTARAMRTTSPQHAGALARKYYDLIGDAEIQEILDRGGHLGEGVMPGNTPTMVEFCQLGQGLAMSDLGSPVCVSLVSPDRRSEFSLLGSDGGLWISEPIFVIQDLFKSAEAIRSSLAHVRYLDPSRSLKKLAPWGEAFQELATRIAEMARRLQPASRWLMLATDPDLAGLPWQNLLDTFYPSMGYVISLVPSFRWATTSLRAAHHYPRGVNLDELSADNTLAELVAEIRNNESTLRDSCDSLAVVAGHGVLPGHLGLSEHPSTLLPLVVGQDERLISPTRWLDLIQYRVLMVHSCFGGFASESFLGDLGGIPHLAMSSSRLLCAPVCEVPTSAALALHKRMFSNRGLSSIGAAYRQAIADNPFVSLYNLYGFASEILTPP
jgi:hypothetical protein